MYTYCTVINILFIVVGVLYILYGIDLILGMPRYDRSPALIFIGISICVILLGFITIGTNWHLEPPIRAIDLIFVIFSFTPAILISVDHRLLQESSPFVKVLSCSYVLFFGLYLIGYTFSESNYYENKMLNDDMYKYTLEYMGYDKEEERAWVSFTDSNGYHKVFLYDDDHLVVGSLDNIKRSDLTDHPMIVIIPDSCRQYAATVYKIEKDRFHCQYILYLSQSNIDWLESAGHIKIIHP